MATATLPSRLVDASRLVDEKIAAEILGITAGTLSVWRCTRRYALPYLKIGPRSAIASPILRRLWSLARSVLLPTSQRKNADLVRSHWSALRRISVDKSTAKRPTRQPAEQAGNGGGPGR